MSKSIKIAHKIEKKWRSSDIKLSEDVDFSALLLKERVLSSLYKAGFKYPSPVQLEAIPMGKFGRDLIVQAKSGTGKSLVFAIVALEALKPDLFRPQVLVIVPTREIAIQVCSVIKAVSSEFKTLTCNSFIGGMPLVEDQAKAVMTQIAVGTPGRLKQLMEMRWLPTNSIRLVVFDEADELMSSSSFQDHINYIFEVLPDDKQVIATSATFNPAVEKMLKKFLYDAHLVYLNRKQLALLGMAHYIEVVEHCPMPVIQYKIKFDALEKILKTLKFAQCLLFVNGIQRVEILYKDVKKIGFSTAYISSAKEQLDRQKAIDRLKRFKCKVLVSSDIIARGIDAENVDLVINFDLTNSTETYMHRAGRAGRYGTIGAAISIINEEETVQFRKIEKKGNFKALLLPDPIPEDLINCPVFDSELPVEKASEIDDRKTEEICIDIVPNAKNLVRNVELNKELPSVANVEKPSEVDVGITKELCIDVPKAENFFTAETCKPDVQNTHSSLQIYELSDESDSDYSDSGEGISDSFSEVSDDTSISGESETDSSETNSSGDDSESDSSSDYSGISSATSVNDRIYYQNKFPRGRQNPSLFSESMNEQIPRRFDSIYTKHCKCCVHYAVPLCYNAPLQSTIRAPQMIRAINRRHNCIHQDTFNGRNDSSYIGRMYANSYHPHHHHHLGCYLPTSHRCHPNIPGYHCETGPLCDMWYRMFYNQWLHIQNVINYF